MSRRQFLATAAGSVAIVGLTRSSLRANPLGLPIGMQIYPHTALLKDFPGFCKTVVDMGVTRLELCSPIGYGFYNANFAMLEDAKQVRTILDDHGLKSESAHFTNRELREDQARSIAWAKQIGMTQMVTASMRDGGTGGPPTTVDEVKSTADAYNRMAEGAAKAGLQQTLHNETFELTRIDGKLVYDMLFDLLDPGLVKFQFQMSTINSGLVGADYFRKYPGRFISMHIQDIDMNAPLPAPPPEGGRGRGGRGRPQVPLGKGSIDWADTFRAAKAGGLKNYFVEQTMELTRQSVEALKAMPA